MEWLPAWMRPRPLHLFKYLSIPMPLSYNASAENEALGFSKTGAYNVAMFLTFSGAFIYSIGFGLNQPGLTEIR